MRADEEAPPCQDGIDNDGDGLLDFDGGLAALGFRAGSPDPQCANRPWHVREHHVKACGAGAELVLLLPVLLWLRLGRCLRALGPRAAVPRRARASRAASDRRQG